MRKPLVAGNWKMHGSRVDNAALVRGLLDALKPESAAEVLLCPPYVYLWETGRLIKDSDVALGAQNVCAETQGAFTGEVSAAMLRDVGCRYVLVGHSERRQIYGESDALVARKFVAAQSQKLVPVLCVGETLDERESGRTVEVVTRQIDAVLAVSGVGALADRRHRLRAGVGHRHRPQRESGAGAGGAWDDPREARGAGCYNCAIREDPVRRQRQGVERAGSVLDAGHRRRARRRCLPQG